MCFIKIIEETWWLRMIAIAEDSTNAEIIVDKMMIATKLALFNLLKRFKPVQISFVESILYKFF